MSVYDDATNSYKHLFFRALLEEFRDGGLPTCNQGTRSRRRCRRRSRHRGSARR